MPRLHRHALPFALVLALLPACPSEEDPPDEPEAQALVDAEAWVRVTDEAADAFADQRPADAVCDDAGWSYDPFRESVEVETEVCNYLTLEQATLVDIAAGDEVTVLGLHDELTAPDPGEGYLGLALEGAVEWEFTVPIPAGVGEIEERFTVDHDVPAGSAIQVHVHNHGPNSWELISVLVSPGGE